MYQRAYKNKSKGQQLAGEGRFSGKQEHAPGWKLVDSRPLAMIQQKLQAAADVGPQAQESTRFQEMANKRQPPVQAVVQLARTKRVKKGTVSGHGGLRRNKKGDLVPYKVPKGKKVIISAPPGATLGDISLVLNTTNNPDFKKIRKMVKISTTPGLWKNKKVVSLVRNNPDIYKTPTQVKALDDLDNGVRSYDDLESAEKGSLTKLEKKDDFEQWAESYVTPETFQVKNEGEEMDDMVLEPFEDKLRSDEDDTADQNDYIEKKQMFSTYMKNHSDLTQVTINACSADDHSDFTGFQIDKKD